MPSGLDGSAVLLDQLGQRLSQPPAAADRGGHPGHAQRELAQDHPKRTVDVIGAAPEVQRPRREPAAHERRGERLGEQVPRGPREQVREVGEPAVGLVHQVADGPRGVLTGQLSAQQPEHRPDVRFELLQQLCQRVPVPRREPLELGHVLVRIRGEHRAALGHRDPAPVPRLPVLKP